MIGGDVLKSSRVWRVVGALVVLLAIGQFLLSGRAFVLGTDLRDFVHGYSAAQQVLAQGWHGLYDIATQERYQHDYIAQSGVAPGDLLILPFVNLPPMVLLFLPLAGLPTQLALGLWVAINVGLASLALVLVARSTSLRAGPWLASALLVPVLLPLVWGLLVGQAVGVFVLLYALTLRGLLRGEDIAAGLWLSLVVIVKPQLVVGALVFLLVQRRWRALGAFSAAVAVIGSISFALVGASGAADYLALLGRLDTFHGDPLLGLRTSLMVNWRSWLALLPGLSDQLGFVLSLAAGLLTLLGVGWAWRRPILDEPNAARAFLCCSAAGVLASYHSHYQDMAILVPPALVAIGFWNTTTAQGGRLALSRPGLALTISAVLLVIVPSAAWVVGGSHALVRAALWALLAAPGLLLLTVATRPAPATSPLPVPRMSDSRVGVRA